MKKIMSVLGLCGFITVGFAMVGETKAQAKAQAVVVDCSCNPACNSNQWCCSTANGGCGCFPFAC